MVYIQIKRKTCTKFLGVYNYINEKLDWTDHVKHIVTPISRNIGILYKVMYFVSDKILVMLYNTLILPYCNILWATCKTVTNNILLLQKNAICVCTRSGFLDHTNPLFVKLRCLKVDDISFLQTAIFMFRFVLSYCLTLFLLRFSITMQFTHIPLSRLQIYI